MTFNTTCLCVFGSVNSFPVDSPCPHPKYHPAEPFRQLLSIDWLGGWNDRSTSYAYVQILIIISTFYRRSFFFFFLPFQFLFIFPSFSRIYVCLWLLCSRRSSEARIGGTRKLKLETNKYFRGKKLCLFEEFSIKKPEREKWRHVATPTQTYAASLSSTRFFLACMRDRLCHQKNRSRWESRARCRKSCPEVDGCPATAGLGRETSPSARLLRREFLPANFVPLIVSFLSREEATMTWKSL